MPRSEEAWLWFTAVYEAVQEIPLGRVTSYGHIARLLGKRECFSRSGPIIGSLVLTAGSRKPSGMSTFIRQVGVALKHLPSASDGPETNLQFHSGNVPWQRVINARGGISPRGPGGASRQAAALRRENVHVDQGSLGEFHVDFSTYGWFPDVLPSEAAVESSSDNDDEERGGGTG